MNRMAIAYVLLLVTATGCLSETREYSLTVRNDLDKPVSVCLTKTHGPDEAIWESPEDLVAPPHPASDQTPPGVTLPPGKTLTHPPFTGKFDRDLGRAFLRVYLGTPNLTQMNAISPGSPDRLDIPLELGPNRIAIVRAENGRMTAVQVTGDWPATEPAP